MYSPFNKLNPSPFDGAVRLRFNTKNAKLIHTHTAAPSPCRRATLVPVPTNASRGSTSRN